MSNRYKPGVFSDSGFTLIELVIIIVVVGVLATTAIPVIGKMVASSREAATKQEILTLVTAITGRADSEQRGYENDVGSPPPTLSGLVSKPVGVASYDRFTRVGWNGPYIRQNNDDYLKDAWGADYVYSQIARTIQSVGGPDTITAEF